jgi:ribosomal-protein-alanine N-acetyltransferase
MGIDDVQNRLNDSVFAEFPILETPRLILRQPATADVQEVFRIFSDPRLRQYSGKEPFHSADDAQSWLNTVCEDYANKNGIRWAICLKENNSYIGSIGFWRILRLHCRAEIGYELSPSFWRTGLMKEAMQEVLLCGFNNMNLHSVEANVTPENEASVRLLKSTGFIQEGLFRQNYFAQGKFLDTASFSILRRNFLSGKN